MKRLIFYVLCTLWIVLLIGCAGVPAPLTEMADAKAAIQSAEEVQAAVYAPVKLESAKGNYSSAETKMTKKKHLEAKDLAIKAKDEAVEAKDISIKAAKIEELKKNAKAAIKDAEFAISGVDIEKAKKYAIIKLDEANTLLSSAKTSFDAEDYQNAINYANQATELAKLAKQEILALEEKVPVVVEKKEEPITINTHKVKKGECLWWIAEYKDIYNNPFKWTKIYKANKNKIKDPHWIYPNQEFVIPRD